MKIWFAIIFSILEFTIYSQNFFPLEKWRSYAVETNHRYYGLGGTSYSYYYYHQYFSIPKVMHNNKEYYTISFYEGTYTLRYDSIQQKLFVYIEATDSEYMAFDFTIPIGVVDSTWITGTKRNYTLTKIDTINFAGANRVRYCFNVSSETPHFWFLDGIGLYYRLRAIATTNPTTWASTLYMAMIDTIRINPIVVQFNSTNLSNIRYIDMFPFSLRIFGSISSIVFSPSIQAIFNIYRNGLLIAEYNFPINPETLTGFIGINQSMVMPNDSIAYKVRYIDNSIFQNNIDYPANGFFYFKVFDIPSSITTENSATNKYLLYDAYPNPLNLSTKIEYEIAQRGMVSLRVYDLLGNEVANLINEIKESGVHACFFDASLLSTGIYFYRLQTERFSKTKKLVLIK